MENQPVPSSFIPKRALAKNIYRRKGVGLFLPLSVFFFALSLLGLAGAFFYKNMAKSQAESLNESLKRTQEVIDVNFLKEIGVLDDKIEAAKIILNDHIITSKIFSFLEASTLKNVSFASFDFSYIRAMTSAPSAPFPKVSLTGSAQSYSSLALQLDELQKNGKIANLATSGLTLGEGGTVNFNIELQFDPSFFAYGAANNQ